MRIGWDKFTSDQHALLKLLGYDKIKWDGALWVSTMDSKSELTNQQKAAIDTLFGGTWPFDEEKVSTSANSEYRALRLLENNPKIPIWAYQKASRGLMATGLQKVAGHRVQIGWGVAVVRIPIRHFFASINEEERHTDLTAVSFAKVVEGNACSDGRAVLMKLPLPILSDRWWITHQYTNPKLREVSSGAAAELVWKEISDWTPTDVHKEELRGLVQIPFTRGSWFMLALDEEHTLAEYHSWVDPGGNIPAGPASRFATGSIEDTFIQMEEFARNQQHSGCLMMWKE